MLKYFKNRCKSKIIDIISSEILKTVYFLLDSDAYRGHYHKNPCMMKPWDIEKFTQTINGVLSPVNPLIFDWANDNYANAYHTLCESIGTLGRNRGNLITYDLYKKSRFMIVLDNSADGSDYYLDAARTKVSSGTIDGKLIQ